MGKVVLAAVRQNGPALGCAAEEMKNNEKVVLTAMHQNYYDARKFVAAEMRATLDLKFEDMRNKFGLESNEECASALLRERVCQVDVCTGLSENGSQNDVVVCTSLAGEILVTMPLTSLTSSHCLDFKLRVAKSIQQHPASLRLLLRDGEELPCGEELLLPFFAALS